MNNQLSDEQTDDLLKKLLQQRALDETQLNEIADSPKLWWQIKNQINAEKSKTGKFPFFSRPRQIFAFGALALIICLGSLPWVISRRGNSETAGQIAVSPRQIQNIENREMKNGDTLVAPKSDESGKLQRNITRNNITSSDSKKSPLKLKGKALVRSNEKASAPEQSLQAMAKNLEPAAKAKEIKSDFIALAYSPAPESGQIVRVKVPRSMMVSLGVTTDIENGSELVNAEVVIGDDGLAHSIRFIH